MLAPMQTAQSGGARSAGQPFFGQTGGATPDSSSGGQPGESGEAFFAKGGGAAQPSSLPPPTQTLKMQQAAARNRAQKPSGKTNDAKPVFKVQAVFDAGFWAESHAPLPSLHELGAKNRVAAACKAMSDANTCQSRHKQQAETNVSHAFAGPCLVPTPANPAVSSEQRLVLPLLLQAHASC